MLEVIKSGEVDIVVMHNLGIPANPKQTIPDKENPVETVTRFFNEKLETLDKEGISKARVLIDPGIGFGKTANHSWQLLQNIDQLNPPGCQNHGGTQQKIFLKRDHRR